MRVKKAKALYNQLHQAIYRTILNSSVPYRQLYRLLHLRQNLASTLQNYRYIYIDVSVIAKHDSHTGIQRVVREIILQLIQDSSINQKLKFVVATKKLSYREITLHSTIPLSFIKTHGKELKPIKPTKDDLFFGLDFCPHIIPYHFTQLIKWRLQGTGFIWVVYDILPLYQPHWFTQAIQDNFLFWFKAITLLADVNLCISRTVKQEVRTACTGFGIYPTLKTIRLGANFITPSLNASQAITSFDAPFVLIVGTLEPRKGQADIINAFTRLWQAHQTTLKLVLIGHLGWGVDEVVKSIYQSAFYQKNLFWLQHIDDQQLANYYQQSAGVIVASYGEGYGLPLIEALYHGKPVLARDTKIFKEVSNQHSQVSYFTYDNQDLSEKLTHWLKTLSSVPSMNENNFNTLSTWQDSKQDILQGFVK